MLKGRGLKVVQFTHPTKKTCGALTPVHASLWLIITNWPFFSDLPLPLPCHAMPCPALPSRPPVPGPGPGSSPATAPAKDRHPCDSLSASPPRKGRVHYPVVANCKLNGRGGGPDQGPPIPVGSRHPAHQEINSFLRVRLSP